MRMTAALIAAASALAVAAPAAAQDTAPERAPFSGLRVGAEVGYDHIRNGSSTDLDTDADVKESIDGVAYGAVIGFDAPVDTNVRLGVEAMIGDSSASRDFGNDTPTTLSLGNVDAEREYYFGGRLGFVTSPDVMVYVKGGYTNQRYGFVTGNGTTTSSQKLDLDGYRVGAGAEYQMANNVYAGLEYRYSNYSKGELDFSRDDNDSNRFEVDTDRHQVLATVGVRF